MAKRSKVGRDLIGAAHEMVAHIRGKIALPVRYVEVPDRVDVKSIRAKSGLSQTEFARRYGFSPRSLQDWEQGRRKPEGAVRAYLLVIDRKPEAVAEALRQ